MKRGQRVARRSETRREIFASDKQAREVIPADARRIYGTQRDAPGGLSDCGLIVTVVFFVNGWWVFLALDCG